jgi:hypothetical protein
VLGIRECRPIARRNRAAWIVLLLNGTADGRENIEELVVRLNRMVPLSVV